MTCSAVHSPNSIVNFNRLTPITDNTVIHGLTGFASFYNISGVAVAEWSKAVASKF